MTSLQEELRNMIGLRKSFTNSAPTFAPPAPPVERPIKTFRNMYESMAQEAGQLREKLNQVFQQLELLELEKQKIEEERQLIEEADEKKRKEIKKLNKEIENHQLYVEAEGKRFSRLRTFSIALTIFLVILILHNHYLNHQLQSSTDHSKEVQQNQLSQLRQCSSNLAKLSHSAMLGSAQLNVTRDECERKVTVVQQVSRSRLDECQKHCSRNLASCVEEMSLLKEVAEEIKDELETQREKEKNLRTVDHLVLFFQSFRRGMATFLGLPNKALRDSKDYARKFIVTKYGCWFDSVAWQYTCRR